jgi:Fanconi anemia group M protein
LISTSVAEEGIDIPAVDLVVLYEPVPSEVRMIQRRGRTGRKSSGRMKVLITKNTRDGAYYWASVRKEDRMKSQLATKEAIDDLKLNERHLPHDPRKHFVTMAKKYGVDEYAVKRLIGHAIDDLTEKVYTERDINWLREEIAKIK